MATEKRNALIRETIFQHLHVGKLNGFFSADDLMPETHLQDDLGADSLDGIELIIAFEEEFDTHVDDEVAEQIKTVGDVYELADKMQAAC